jgi:hypothetical protein
VWRTSLSNPYYIYVEIKSRLNWGMPAIIWRKIFELERDEVIREKKII